MLIVAPHLSIPPGELQFTFVRSSGPGGQNVNKVNTKAVLRWNFAASAALRPDVRARFLAKYGNRITVEGDLVISSQRFRDQRQNERDCLEKLRGMLLTIATPPKRRRPTKPTKGSVERRRTSKREHSQKKEGRRKVGDE